MSLLLHFFFSVCLGFGSVRFGSVWFDLVRFGLFGSVWFGSVWFGLVRLKTLLTLGGALT